MNESVHAGTTLAQELHTRRIAICLGPGGVGKTTTAAALGLSLAAQGRDVCVVTFDPARRLASALGLTDLPNDPVRIAVDETGSGAVYACMLDARATFDAMVTRYATDEDQVARIFANPVYRNLTENLSGTHEYMAMERLYELHQDARFDLIIVDTPPSIGALDILRAPRRLVSFLDNRVFNLLVKPGPAYLKPLSLATRTLVRAISRVVGSEVVDDAIAFFQDFAGIEEGFKARAREVGALVESKESYFVLVTAPRTTTLKEMLAVKAHLEETAMHDYVTVVNRWTPEFDAVSERPPHEEYAETYVILEANLRELRSLREDEERAVAAALDDQQRLRTIVLENEASEITSITALRHLGDALVSAPIESRN